MKSLLLTVFLSLSTCVMSNPLYALDEIDKQLPTNMDRDINHLDITPLECKIIKPVQEAGYIGRVSHENGLEAYYYDTNGDGDIDVSILIPQGDENRYPWLYVFDLDFDYQPDSAFADKLRDGTCGMIELYWWASQHNKVNYTFTDKQ